MKTKTVKSIIGKKHKAWLESITDEEVRKVAKDGTFVTGGAVASLLMVGDLNDLDIYFRDTYSAIIVADYYAKMFNKKKNKESVKLQYADITTSSVEGYGGGDESVDIDVADAHKFKGATDPIKVFIKSSGFYTPLHYLGRAKMANTAEVIKLIIRDETVHGTYIGYKFRRGISQLPESEQLELKEWVINIAFDLWNNELKYTKELYDTIGWTEDVNKFLEYNLNKALDNLGLDPLFTTTAKDVNSIVINGLSTSTSNHDFFSQVGNGYLLGEVEPIKALDFNMLDNLVKGVDTY